MTTSSRQAFKRALSTKLTAKANGLGTEEIISLVVETLSELRIITDGKVDQEIRDLATYIQNMKQELSSLRPHELRDEQLQTATDELDAVVTSTEEATGKILAAAEELMNLAGSGSHNPDELNNLAMGIFEACSFQDLTGQRIGKVVKALKHIEERVNRLIKIIGDELAGVQPSEPSAVSAEGRAQEEIDGLLNGPALNGPAIDQDEIDKLLNG